MANNVMTYIWMLGLVTSIVLTVIGILRWLKDADKRKHRLNIVSGFAFCILVLLLLSVSWSSVSAGFNQWFGDNEQATASLIITSKITIKVLLIVLVVAFAVMLTVTAAGFVLYGLWAMIYTVCSFGEPNKESLKKDLQDKADKLLVLLNNPVFILIIVGGILAVFGILPVVMGGNSESLAECWISGVKEIAVLCKGGNKMKFSAALSLYMLVYIAVVGVGYAVAYIIYEIIKDLLKSGNKRGFWSEYSNCIGLMAVGVSVLLMASSGSFNLDSDTTFIKRLSGFARPFFTVLLIIALGVLALEIVRLLIDMKETLIRKEARYVFVMLVGCCAVIIVNSLSLLYNAFVKDLAGNEMKSDGGEDRMEKIQVQIIEQIDRDLREEIHRTAYGSIDNTKFPFAVFEKRVNKK